MKRFQKILTVAKQAGFTMVELLIVIAILGILTVAVLSAINPIEQINRGRDSGTRSDAEQIIGSIDRFYTYNGFYPWAENVNDPNTDTSATTGTDYAATGFLKIVDDTWIKNGTAGDCEILAILSVGDTSATDICDGANELKSAFIDRLNRPSSNTVYVYNRGGVGDSSYVCFAPRSAAFLNEANVRCTDGLPTDLNTAFGEVCPTANPAATLYCLP